MLKSRPSRWETLTNVMYLLVDITSGSWGWKLTAPIATITPFAIVLCKLLAATTVINHIVMIGGDLCSCSVTSLPLVVASRRCHLDHLA